MAADAAAAFDAACLEEVSSLATTSLASVLETLAALRFSARCLASRRRCSRSSLVRAMVKEEVVVEETDERKMRQNERRLSCE